MKQFLNDIEKMQLKIYEGIKFMGKERAQNNIYFQDYKRSLRKKYKNIVDNLTYPKIINNTFESCVKIYIVEWDGTKDELIKELYTNEAKRIYGPYDCTGEPFTTFFQVGHLKSNIYKVAEGISLDL